MFKNKLIRNSCLGIVGIFLIGAIILSIIWSLTLSQFRFPKSDHYHFRLQYIYKGQSEDFGSPRYQTDYIKDVCNGTITESPIHFHDNKDQIVHIHWQGIKGADVLKFYGVNMNGGIEGAMGLKFDELFKFPPKWIWLPIHSNSLPKAVNGEQYFVYTGDQNNYVKKDFKKFTEQTIEDFLGVSSKIRLDKEEVEKFQKKNTSFLLNGINAEAHNGEEHQTLSEAEAHDQNEKLNLKEKQDQEIRNNQAVDAKSKTERIDENSSLKPNKKPNEKPKTEEELKQINNLIGNIVIFVQKDEPSDEQVKTRFNKLERLSASVCGG